MENKDNETLEEVSDINESFAMFGGIAVIFGVAIELGVTFELDEKYKWWLFFANFLVAFGVLIEVICSRISRSASDVLRVRAKIKIAELDHLTAEANKRAAILEKEATEVRERTAEIEKLTEWRHVSQAQLEKIADSVRSKSSSIDVLIEYERSDPEAFSYAYEIANIFAKSGVTKIRCGQNSYLATVFGLLLTISPEIESILTADTFISAGLSVEIVKRDLSKHLPSSDVAPNVYIFVAPRVPPFIKALRESKAAR